MAEAQGELEGKGKENDIAKGSRNQVSYGLEGCGKRVLFHSKALRIQ